MLLIPSMNILATGDSDKNDNVIRLFENVFKSERKNPKILRGHNKSIKCLAFCEESRYLISCSYEFDVLVWNTYLCHPVCKLTGHESPLVSVMSVNI